MCVHLVTDASRCRYHINIMRFPPPLSVIWACSGQLYQRPASKSQNDSDVIPTQVLTSSSRALKSAVRCYFVVIAVTTIGSNTHCFVTDHIRVSVIEMPRRKVKNCLTGSIVSSLVVDKVNECTWSVTLLRVSTRALPTENFSGNTIILQYRNELRPLHNTSEPWCSILVPSSPLWGAYRKKEKKKDLPWKQETELAYKRLCRHFLHTI